MATEDISLRVRIDQIESALRSIPGMTDASMKRVAAAASKNWKEVEKQAKDAAKAAERASKEAADQATKAAEKQLGAMKQLGNAVTGGLVGDLADMAEALGPVGIAAAVTTGGLIAMASAAAGLVAGILAVQEAAKSTIEELDKLGMSELITAEQRQAIADTEAAFAAVKAAIGLVAVELAENFAPDIEQAARSVIALTFSVQELLGEFSRTSILENFVVSALAVAEAMIDIEASTAILASALGHLQEAVTGQPSELRRWGDAVILAKKDLISAATGIDRLKDGTEELSDSERRAQEFMDRFRSTMAEVSKSTHSGTIAHKDHTAQVKAEADAYAELGRIAAEATSDQQTDLDKIVDAWQKRTEAAQKAIKTEADLAFALDEINQRFYRDFAALKAKEVKTAQDAAKKEAATVAAWTEKQAQVQIEAQQKIEQAKLESGQRLLEAIQAETEAERQAYEQLYGTILGVLGPLGDLGNKLAQLSEQQLSAIRDERQALRDKIKEATGYEKVRLEQRLDQLEEEGAAYRRLQLVAFRTRKAIAISEAIVNGAVAATRALAELGPVAGAIAAGVIATGTAAEVALISSERPKFHTGLDPSETSAVLTKGEGVANVRAMAQPGFREQLAAANAGTAAPMTSAPVVIALNDRILAELDARTQRVRGRVAGGRVVRLGTATHYG